MLSLSLILFQFDRIIEAESHEVPNIFKTVDYMRLISLSVDFYRN